MAFRCHIKTNHEQMFRYMKHTGKPQEQKEKKSITCIIYHIWWLYGGLHLLPLTPNRTGLLFFCWIIIDHSIGYPSQIM